MREVIYFTSVSVDGFIGSDSGDDSWVVPDEELHRHFNDLEAAVDTHLYGRRMYEIMAGFWPTAEDEPGMPDYVLEYARIWKPMPKVVFSQTLREVGWNSRLFSGDACGEVARLKQLPGLNMSVGGCQLAASLAQAGLIDEYRIYVMPTIVGSGTPMFSALGRHIALEPVEVRRFSGGAVLLRYRAKGEGAG